MENENMNLKCEMINCREVSPVSEWNEATKESNGENFYPIEKCFEEFENLEGMHFCCPKCKQINDGLFVEPVVKTEKLTTFKNWKERTGELTFEVPSDWLKDTIEQMAIGDYETDFIDETSEKAYVEARIEGLYEK